MAKLSEKPDLKEINALKKKFTWGDVPAIYQLAASSVSELDGILTHGFDSAYRQMFNKSHWNLELLESYHDDNGDLQVKHKPQITLKHVYTEQSYELHCFPVINGENIHQNLAKHPLCPFENWTPELMQLLFRVNSIVSFIIYSFKGGDEADMALIRFAHLKVQELIEKLMESFEVKNIIGYNIAEFCHEIQQRSHMTDVQDLLSVSSSNE